MTSHEAAAVYRTKAYDDWITQADRTIDFNYEVPFGPEWR